MRSVDASVSTRTKGNQKMTQTPRAPKIGVRIPPCEPIPVIAGLAKQAEEAGFDAIAVPDSPALWRDTLTTLCFIGAETENVLLAPWVTNLVTRSPMMLASAARTVADFAPGRLRLGLAVGDSAVTLTGERPSRSHELRERTATLRRLLVGESVECEINDLMLHDPCGPIPLYLSANGPRNLAVAVDVADGLITNYRDIERKFQFVDELIAKEGRENQLYRATIVSACVTDDVEREAHLMKPKIANHISRDGTAMLAEAGFSVDVPHGHIKLADGTNLGHPRDLNEAIRVAEQWISDDLAMWWARNIYFFGTADEIAARLVRLSDLGVDEVVITHHSAFVLPTDLIEVFGSDVLPKMRAMTAVSPAVPG